MQLEPKAKSRLVGTEGTNITHGVKECFLCGKHETRSVSLHPIMRWKPLSRAVKLIHDFVCGGCLVKHYLKSSQPNAKQ